ncbi:MAG: hypothetical protein MAGBODY4_01688 [Candidatus Marinimicrobia bacterium]|nr:hypothetical protein [Candidatus Neomarinimicrobiota bacterium]
MSKFFTLLSNELQQVVRHPNREVIPVLIFGVLSYIGLEFGLQNLIPTIQQVDTTLWFLPGLILFYLMFVAYQYANAKILEKVESGYLSALRSNAASPWTFVFAFIADTLIVSIVKALIIVGIFAILTPDIGGFIPWMGILGIGALTTVFWAGAGIVLGLLRKEYLAASQIFSHIILPLLAVTGLLIPIQVYPGQIELITLLIPATYGFELSRATLGIVEFQGWMLAALFGWAIAAVSLAVYALHTEGRR